MGTIHFLIPDALKSFVDEQVADRGYSTSSEYVLELIRNDADRLQLRALLLEGAACAPAGPADAAYFDALPKRIQQRRIEDLEDAKLVRERADGPFVEVNLDDL